MMRRDALKLLGATLGAGGTLGGPLAALARPAPVRAVFDSRFAAARSFAAAYAIADDCAEDAATLWYRVLGSQPANGATIVGLTTAADAMILADCARSVGCRLAVTRADQGAENLICWHIG